MGNECGVRRFIRGSDEARFGGDGDEPMGSRAFE
jgi:hypothetical protein